MPTSNTKLELNWENLLTEAVTKPRQDPCRLQLVP
jgi:hypothetical protein